MTDSDALANALHAAATWTERNGIGDVPDVLILCNVLPTPAVGAWRAGLDAVPMRQKLGDDDVELCEAVGPAVEAILRRGGEHARAVLEHCSGEHARARLRAIVDPGRGCVVLQMVEHGDAHVIGALLPEMPAEELH
ncbi:MAG TPA: hypothetical protein PKJ45_08455 [Rubrivivax sp.]|nr:hypothetical protein [Rubrivivax sp.]